MKTSYTKSIILSLAAVFLMLAVGLLMSGCNREEQESDNYGNQASGSYENHEEDTLETQLMTGRWQLGVTTLSFADDGLLFQTTPAGSHRGSWSLNGNVLNISGGMNISFTDRDWHIAISGDTLTFADPDGMVRNTFTRSR